MCPSFAAANVLFCPAFAEGVGGAMCPSLAASDAPVRRVRVEVSRCPFFCAAFAEGRGRCAHRWLPAML